MKPYKFEPYLKQTLWGGGRIASFKGIRSDLPDVGESWEISGVAGRESVSAERGIANDADVGKSLAQLIGEYRGDLVGEDVYRRFGNAFPLLVKLLDAKRDLSIQVHPGDELAQRRHGCCGKSEMWYVVEAGAGARICAGFKRSITPEEFERRIGSGRPGNPLEDVLAYHEAHAGDAFFLPAGRLHSIGAGTFLVEVQQASDITYRVYDYGRRDARGRLRELHVAEARDAIDYRACPECRIVCDATKPTCELVACPHFKVGRATVRGVGRIDLASDSFVVAVCLAGRAIVNGVSVRQGETLLVPAVDNVLSVHGDAAFLTATIPH